jgi:hypothetical protein
MRIKIEVEDRGMKSAYEFESQELEGEDLRDKIVSYLSAAGVFAEKDTAPSAHAYNAGGTLMDKLENFIRFEFPDTWFTSQQLRDKYETVSDDIKLSTVSTYLSRMNRDGLLDRRGNRNNRHYRLLAEAASDLSSHDVIQARKRSAEGRW